jgi:glycosyltransferase involved in cell wall biosynthesis
MTVHRPLRLLSVPSDGASLRVAVVAPPWIPVPPPSYGGTEAVVALLCEGLVARGHNVTLFAAPGSSSPARVQTPLESSHRDRIGSALLESDHVGCAFDAIAETAENGDRFDVIHDHSGYTAVAMASRISTPVVHTLHLPFTRERALFYRRHAHKVQLVAISRSQREHAPLGVRVDAVVPNPIAVERWPLETQKDDYLLWIGRMDPVKGAHRAIEVARRAGRDLVLAGPVQKDQPGQAKYYRDHVKPHIDDRQIRYKGEVSGLDKQELFARAAALLMPIRWQEPFGMVMIEALACGTPVIAFPEGAASEIVIDGHNGLLVTDEAEMARAVAHVERIDSAACRESVRERYDVDVVARGYEGVDSRAIATTPRPEGETRGDAGLDAGEQADETTR